MVSISYKEVRDKIRTGDLLIWKKDRTSIISNFFLSIVRLLTRSEFGHVAIAWRCGDRLFIFEATTPVVRIVPVSDLDEFYHIPMHFDVQDEAIDFLLDKVGSPYSTMDAFRAYLGIRLAKEDSWQCVELANYFYQELGEYHKDAWTPTSFVNSVLEHPDRSLYLVRQSAS